MRRLSFEGGIWDHLGVEVILLFKVGSVSVLYLAAPNAAVMILDFRFVFISLLTFDSVEYFCI